MRHLHLTVIDNRHLAHFFMIARILLLDARHESAVNFLHNLIYTGKQPGEKLNGPLLKSLRHNRMVRVCASLRRHIPSLVPCKIMFIHQDTHQLRDSHSRMGIIELECDLLIELPDIFMFTHIFGNRFLYGGGDKEILLF